MPKFHETKMGQRFYSQVETFLTDHVPTLIEEIRTFNAHVPVLLEKLGNLADRNSDIKYSDKDVEQMVRAGIRAANEMQRNVLFDLMEDARKKDEEDGIKK